MGRSRKVISAFLSNKLKYGKNNKGGNNRVISAADKRAILREASNSHASTAKIRANVNVKASLSTIQRVIRSAPHLKRLKLKKKPPLNVARKEVRLNFAREHMTWNSDWRYVVFSDEKKLIWKVRTDTTTTSMIFAKRNTSWIAFIVGLGV